MRDTCAAPGCDKPHGTDDPYCATCPRPEPTALTRALIEAGRVLEEETQPLDRREIVRTWLDKQPAADRENFILGVLIWAHEMRWWLENFVPPEVPANWKPEERV